MPTDNKVQHIFKSAISGRPSAAARADALPVVRYLESGPMFLIGRVQHPNHTTTQGVSAIWRTDGEYIWTDQDISRIRTGEMVVSEVLRSKALHDRKVRTLSQEVISTARAFLILGHTNPH